MAGEYDFYRTRLTHSMEVSQIGRSICGFLNRTSDFLEEGRKYVDPALVEAACLAHDIGHPSFGHAGESALNELMSVSDGFEGNAQNLRILTELFYADKKDGGEGGRKGMRPTRAFLSAMLKYKALHGEYVAELNSGNVTGEGNAPQKPDNHFLYNSQRHILDFVFGGLDWRTNLKDAHSRNSFKSIECQIMDWADDVAYSTSDMQDGIEARFITVEGVHRFLRDQTDDITGQDEKLLEELCGRIVEGTTGKLLNAEVGKFLTSVSLGERENFASGSTNSYRYELVIDPEVKKRCKLYKVLARELVFRTPQVHQLEYKGGKVLRQIFEAFMENAALPYKKRLALLPRGYEALVDGADDALKPRIVCDYVSGMTDAFVVKTYKRLFDPAVGSIADLI